MNRPVLGHYFASIDCIMNCTQSRVYIPLTVLFSFHNSTHSFPTIYHNQNTTTEKNAFLIARLTPLRHYRFRSTRIPRQTTESRGTSFVPPSSLFYPLAHTALFPDTRLGLWHRLRRLCPGLWNRIYRAVHYFVSKWALLEFFSGQGVERLVSWIV